MRAIILAAGRGSRMLHMTEAMPKGMVPLYGKPLILHQLESLKSAGVTEVSIVGGYKSEMLPLQSFSKVYINHRWMVTNMLSSLISASEQLLADDCIVSYSDIFYDSSAPRSLLECPESIAITFDKNFLELWSARFSDPLLDLESLMIDENGFLLTIGDKATHIDQIQGQYMGLLKFTPKIWLKCLELLADLSPDKVDKLDMTSFLKLLISKKVAIKAIPFSGLWGEIDHVTDYNYYHSDSFLSRTRDANDAPA